MARTLKPGEQVTWDTPQGKTRGKVEKKLTSKTKIKGHVAKPSKQEPQYLVRSDKSGGEAVHRPEALEKL